MYIPQFWCGVAMILLIEAFGIVVFTAHCLRKEEKKYEAAKKANETAETDSDSKWIECR